MPLAVITPGSEGPPWAPTLGPVAGSVQWTAADGAHARAIPLAKLIVERKPPGTSEWQPLLQHSSVDLTCYFTASRLVIVSEQHDRSRRIGAHQGAGLEAIAAWRSARQRNGSVLVGHVLHRWLSAVAAVHGVANTQPEVRCLIESSGSGQVGLRYRLLLPYASELHPVPIALAWACDAAADRGAPTPQLPPPGETAVFRLHGATTAHLPA